MFAFSFFGIVCRHHPDQLQKVETVLDARVTSRMAGDSVYGFHRTLYDPPNVMKLLAHFALLLLLAVMECYSDYSDCSGATLTHSPKI